MNVFDMGGWSPLIRAVRYGNPDTVKILLEAKADVNTKKNNVWCPLHKATRYGKSETLMILLEAKADVNVRTKHGGSPLLFSVQSETGVW